MADDSMSLLETLRKVSADGDLDLLREGVRLLAQVDHGGRGERAHRGTPRASATRSSA